MRSVDQGMTIPMTQAVAALARESRPYFLEIEAGLEQWQADPGNPAILGQARKRLRSIWGAAGLLELEGLAEAARQFNGILESAAGPGGAGKAHDGRVPVSARPLVQCARLMQGHLEDVAQGEAGDTRLNAALGQLQLWLGMQGGVRGHAAHLSGQFVDVFREEAWAHLGAITKGLRELKRVIRRPEQADAARNALHTLKGAAGVIGLYEASAVAHELEDLMEEAREMRDAGAGSLDEIQACLQEVFHQLARCCGVPAGANLGYSAEETESREPHAAAAGELHVRLPLRSLDHLAGLATELAALPAQNDRREQGQLKTELIAVIGRLRCAPFVTLEDRLRRTVAAAALRLGKDAVLEFEGGAADIDRGLIEELTAPLEHLLRNAVDHGLEDASLRVAAGKSAAGNIRVRTYVQGEQFVVEVADDGCGVNTARLRRKAVEKGILPLEDALELSEAEATNLVFAAGLSTANQVSELSGRGVGLAIVKQTVDRLGGQKVVESRIGLGTTFRLILPMRTGHPAAVRVLEAGTASGVYAIRASAVVRVLRLAQGRLEWDAGQRVLVLGDERFPALLMDEALGRNDAGAEPEVQCPALLLESKGRRIAWIVDRIGGMPEVTVRPLGAVTSLLGALPGVGGVVMSGDEAMLMLDVEQLVELALVSREVPSPVESSYSYWELESKAS
jgi:chemotaxis protein histidine kinase CheA